VWRRPVGGMFVWIRLLGVDDARDFFESLKESNVVVMPGHVSLAEKTTYDGSTKFCPHIRISFSYIDANAIAEGIRRAAELYKSKYHSDKGYRT
jgi:kynurenine/2-aminoadipate aminotransferase